MAKKVTAKKTRKKPNPPPAVTISPGPGQPTAYKPEFVELVYRLSLLGMTDEEAAKFFNVNEATLKRWDQAHPEFRASRVRARDEADADVAVKLRDRALGYSHKSEKIFLDRNGGVVRAETIEHYPPDTKAAELWLFNRQPDKWRPRRDPAEADRDNELTIKIVGGLPE